MSFNNSCSEIIVLKEKLNKNFTPIPNFFIRDKRLDFKSTGLLVYLLACKSGSLISIEYLCKVKLDGESAIRSAKALLEKLGYLKVIKCRDDTGRFSRVQWIVANYTDAVLDYPERENPVLDKRVEEFPRLEEQQHISTDVVNITKNITTTTTEDWLSCFEDKGKCWLWLCGRIGVEPDKTHLLFGDLSTDLAIDILCEVYSIKKQGGIKKTESQLINSLIRAANASKFNLSAGLSLRTDLPKIVHGHEEDKTEPEAVFYKKPNDIIAHKKAMSVINGIWSPIIGGK